MHHPVPLLFSLPPIWPRSWSATLLGQGAGRHSDASDGRFPGSSTLKSGKKKMGITDNERTFYGFPWLSMLF